MRAYICWSVFSLQSLHILQNGRPISCSIYGLKLSYQSASLFLLCFLGLCLRKWIAPLVYGQKKYSFLLKAEILYTNFLPYFLGTISTTIDVFEPQYFSVVYFQTLRTIVWNVGTDGLFGLIMSKKCPLCKCLTVLFYSRLWRRPHHTILH